MNVSQLIEKLKTVDPNLLVCAEDGEMGLHADVELYEVTAYVDRRGSFDHPFVSTLRPNNPIGQHDGNERIVVLTRWGQTDTKEAREL